MTDTAGTTVTPLTCAKGNDIDPAWSPDGTRIAFASDRSGNWDIWVMNRDGSGQTRLTADPARDSHPTWSPDGTQIAFESGRGAAPNTTDIWVMNADGSNPRPLVQQDGQDRYPAWSPDGKQIAFAHYGDGADAGIWTVAPATGKLLQLTSGADGSPAWSPDMTQLVFDGQHDCAFEVFRLTLATGRVVQLTKHPEGCGGYDKHPSYSPDGSAIVYWTDRTDASGVSDYLYRIRGSGGTPVQLLGPGVVGQYTGPYDPAWSPGS